MKYLTNLTYLTYWLNPLRIHALSMTSLRKSSLSDPVGQFHSLSLDLVPVC